MATPSSSPESELIARIARRDVSAFSDFYDRAAALMYSVALRMLNQAAEAEDVVQEAFASIWENATAFDPAMSSPLSWAVVIVRHKAIDRLRRAQRRGRIIDAGQDPAEVIVADELPANGHDLAALRQQVREALGALGPAERRAIDLAFFGGLTQSEIARQLGEPLGTVKARIRRGLLRLRAPLEKIRLESR